MVQNVLAPHYVHLIDLRCPHCEARWYRRHLAWLRNRKIPWKCTRSDRRIKDMVSAGWSYEIHGQRPTVLVRKIILSRGQLSVWEERWPKAVACDFWTLPYFVRTLLIGRLFASRSFSPTWRAQYSMTFSRNVRGIGVIRILLLLVTFRFRILTSGKVTNLTILGYHKFRTQRRKQTGTTLIKETFNVDHLKVCDYWR